MSWTTFLAESQQQAAVAARVSRVVRRMCRCPNTAQTNPHRLATTRNHWHRLDNPKPPNTQANSAQSLLFLRVQRAVSSPVQPAPGFFNESRELRSPSGGLFSFPAQILPTPWVRYPPRVVASLSLPPLLEKRKVE